MANNCAVLFYRDNKDLMQSDRPLEIEINNGDTAYLYKKTESEIQNLDNICGLLEKRAQYFITDLVSNNLDACKRQFEKTPVTSEKELESFLKAFSTAIPPGYKTTRLIGYRMQNSDREDLYIADCVMTSNSEFQKLVNFTFLFVENDYKLREINF